MGRRFVLLIALTASLLLLNACDSPSAPAPSSSNSALAYNWDTYNTDIKINDDGSLDVTQQQGLVLTSGTLGYFYEALNTTYSDSISQIKVAEQGGANYTLDNSSSDSAGLANTYKVSQDGKTIKITWYYGSLNAPATKTMLISYHIVGGLRVYSTDDQLYWTAVPGTHSSIINSSQTTVTVPDSIDLLASPKSSIVYPTKFATITKSAHEVTFKATAPIKPNTPYAVQVQWPHGLIPATPGAWQQAAESLATPIPPSTAAP